MTRTGARYDARGTSNQHDRVYAILHCGSHLGDDSWIGRGDVPQRVPSSYEGRTLNREDLITGLIVVGLLLSAMMQIWSLWV